MGNMTIATAKLIAYQRTGHSAMFAEFVHTWYVLCECVYVMPVTRFS